MEGRGGGWDPGILSGIDTKKWFKWTKVVNNRGEIIFSKQIQPLPSLGSEQVVEITKIFSTQPDFTTDRQL